MKPGRKTKPVPISQRRAIGNLLRLADSRIRDGRLLLQGSRPSNVAMLVELATTHMVEAIVISEWGRMIPSADALPEIIDDDNSVKKDLAALAAHIQREPPLLPDGRLRKLPDEAVLSGWIDRSVAVLTDVIEHFDVDLAGQDPAGHAKPMRPEPVAPTTSARAPVANRPFGDDHRDASCHVNLEGGSGVCSDARLRLNQVP